MVTVVFVTNTYCRTSTYLINSPKVKASAKTSISDTNAGSQILKPFPGVSFINNCLLQLILHVNNPLHQFADIKDFLLSIVSLFFRFYSPEL